MTDTASDVQNVIAEAEKGRELWARMAQDIGYKDDWWLVILPEDNKEIEDTLIENLSDIMKEKYCKQAVLIGTEDILIDDPGVLYLKMNADEIKALLRYYRLLQFTENIYVASDRQPYGCGAIIGKKGISMEDYVRDAIFTKRG